MKKNLTFRVFCWHTRGRPGVGGKYHKAWRLGVQVPRSSVGPHRVGVSHSQTPLLVDSHRRDLPRKGPLNYFLILKNYKWIIFSSPDKIGRTSTLKSTSHIHTAKHIIFMMWKKRMFHMRHIIHRHLCRIFKKCPEIFFF